MNQFLFPPLSYLLVIVSLIVLGESLYLQGDGAQYVKDFPSLMALSYTALEHEAPSGLLTSGCINPTKYSSPQSVVIVVAASSSNGVITAREVQTQCGTMNTCIVQGDVVLWMDSPLQLYALVIRDGAQFIWHNESQKDESLWICAGYISVEVGGSFVLSMPDKTKRGWIYITNNGASHPILRTRAFGGVGTNNTHDIQPFIDIMGRELDRTWSLLSIPLVTGDSQLQLQHDPIGMGWQIGDRIAVAPTEDRSQGKGQSFVITNMKADGTLFLDHASVDNHDAQPTFVSPTNPSFPLSQSAEVINLSRNIIITGDDYEEIKCDATLDEAVQGEQTSTVGCRCATFRGTCTMGLHTAQMHGGVSRIQNTRVEKCGQRGVEGKYCLHFHFLGDCPNCLLRNNAIEVSQQRGLVIHQTHRSVAMSNVFYNVRGASLYIEDGNEIQNILAYNVAICPWSLQNGGTGCSVPGTSNDQADTSLNQAGLYSEAPSNHLIGNRMANHFNGMFVNANGHGRGLARGKVCPNRTPYGRIELNTFHSSGRFGTYALHDNYPVHTSGQSLSQNGYVVGCNTSGPNGEDNGYSLAIRNNFDYGNAFVGHYAAGDIQYKQHTSRNNLNLIYWKETKSFADGCSAHITQSYFESGTMALPDSLGSFIIQDSVLVDVLLEANHHCNIGSTGILCMPQYILDNVTYIDTEGRSQWVSFDLANNAGGGGIFSLSPHSVASPTTDSFFPSGFVALVSNRFPWLLRTELCNSSDSLGLRQRYQGGILCRSPLRAFKIFSNGLAEGTAPSLQLQVWNTNSKAQVLAEQLIPFGSTSQTKQGYAFPLIPGSSLSYHISLKGGGNIPSSWILDFSDQSISNRWGVEELYVTVQGRDCGSVVLSNHDRFYINHDVDQFLNGLGWGRGACTSYPSMPIQSCSSTLLEEGPPPASEFPSAFLSSPFATPTASVGPKMPQSPFPTSSPTSTFVIPTKSVTDAPTNTLLVPSPTSMQVQSVAPSANSLILVNAATGRNITQLVEGAQVVSSDTGTSLTVVALFTGIRPQFVTFDLDGVVAFRVELSPPYSLGGDFRGKWFSVESLADVGPHTITAKAFVGFNAVRQVTVHFTVA